MCILYIPIIICILFRVTTLSCVENNKDCCVGSVAFYFVVVFMFAGRKQSALLEEKRNKLNEKLEKRDKRKKKKKDKKKHLGDDHLCTESGPSSSSR